MIPDIIVTIDDDKLVLIAKKETRIIITKDHALAVSAIQHDITIIQIQTHTEKEQLIEIAKAMNWKRFSLMYPMQDVLCVMACWSQYQNKTLQTRYYQELPNLCRNSGSAVNAAHLLGGNSY